MRFQTLNYKIPRLTQYAFIPYSFSTEGDKRIHESQIERKVSVQDVSYTSDDEVKKISALAWLYVEKLLKHSPSDIKLFDIEIASVIVAFRTGDVVYTRNKYGCIV